MTDCCLRRSKRKLKTIQLNTRRKVKDRGVARIFLSLSTCLVLKLAAALCGEKGEDDIRIKQCKSRSVITEKQLPR